MTAGVPFPQHAKPYAWDETRPPPPDSLRLWNEVGNGIDKSQTVVWKSAVESLGQANQFLKTSEDARCFIEKYMGPIIGILVEQQPTKIGPHERNCVQESLALAVIIVARDLEIQLARNGECMVLDVLAVVFNKKKAYYKGTKANWNVNHMSGLPEFRLKMIEKFREHQGFTRLHRYMVERINTAIFPNLDSLHQILSAIGDALPNRTTGTDHGPASKEMEEAAIAVANATMQFINSCSDEALKKLPPDQLNTVQHDLQRMFDRLVSTRRESTYEFYEFWRALILKLITSQSLPLKLFGWQQVDELLEASAEHRPPPRAFDVSDAGVAFVNGRYEFAGPVTTDGYAERGVDICYERIIPESEKNAGGKKLTLFRCTMRSQQKWWFLSEADEEQPGTDRDIDYYQHKSKEHEETEPPPRGWITCRSAGVEPAPHLKSIGLMVPPGEELNTLEHQLAKWAIENGIIELVLGDSVHREVVARSTALIKFLASMCERDSPSAVSADGRKPNMYCLQTSHLLLAWKTCTRKADAAVSAQVYQLLVSILPSCPGSLAIPLLKAVQASLFQSKEKKDYLVEVGEFCSALASANSVDSKSASVTNLSDDVRAEVLELLWAVLTHPDASTLKSYDSLKRYVTNELRVEPKGSEHRENYLKSCVDTLSANSKKQSNGSVDENQALRMVKLTHFVLEACPRAQAAKLVMNDGGALPILLFNELTAFQRRRKSSPVSAPLVRKSPTRESDAKVETGGLFERLRILRYVYGLSESIVMNSPQLHNLWELCSLPPEQEELMIFIASASGNGLVSTVKAPAMVDQPSPAPPANSVHAEDVLSPAFTDEVCSAVFLDLFCSPTVSFELLGEGAYRSFQFMFNKLRLISPTGHAPTEAALDALWGICLRAGNDAVATQAMKDLLAVYVANNVDNNGWAEKHTIAPDQMQTESNEDSFGNRVFECLANVKQSLEAGDSSAELAAERCLRILNAAIGQGATGGSSITTSTLTRLGALSPNDGLRDILKYLPHGMRGQACYRKIGIMAKRTLMHTQTGTQAQQAYPARDDTASGTNQSRNSSTLRFSLDVHPLETLLSVKAKVAAFSGCSLGSVKPISVSGRLASSGNRPLSGDSSQMSLNVVPDDSVVDELGIVQGCEMVFVIAERQLQQSNNAVTAKASRNTRSRDLSDIFCNESDRFADKLFQTLLGVLEALPWREPETMTDVMTPSVDTHKLVWDLLLAMPTNSTVASRVRVSAGGGDVTGSSISDDDAMEVDSRQDQWSKLLDLRSFHKSVYVLLAIDAFLQPAVEVVSSLDPEQRTSLEREMKEEAVGFRRGFIESGGFDAVVRFFSASEAELGMRQSKTRMGNAVALRILKCCVYGNNQVSRQQRGTSSSTLDDAGGRLLHSLSDADGLLRSLTAMVVGDVGISTSTISDVLKFLRLLFRSPRTAKGFVSLPDGMAERFLITLLLWEGGPDGTRPSSSVGAAAKVRKSTHDLILMTPMLTDHALPWLIRAIDMIEVVSDSTTEYFDVLQKLVGDDRSIPRSRNATDGELRALATAVCKKLSSCPRPTTETAMIDFSTGVLCGCLALLRALIENGGGSVLRDGTGILVKDLGVTRWTELFGSSSRGMFSMVSPFRVRPRTEDLALIDLMGVIFDAFLSPGGSSSVVAICCDKESRQRGFDVVGAAARSCAGGDGYLALVNRVNGIVSSAAPFLRHRWGLVGGGNDSHSRSGRNTSKYSGLRNQGCTCYMNSVLQQLFMMPELRRSICSATLPAVVRASGGVVSSKGAELVGKKVAMQWDNGVAYDAIVEGFDRETGMHTIRYCAMPVATVGGSGHQQVQPEDIDRLPPLLPEEFFLSEGRPGKETGVFEVVSSGTEDTLPVTANTHESVKQPSGEVEESEDEATSRHLMEEVQRTFIHLDEGSRGRCFDPRALVEACACLKLEFDVWQQNDASEFATKLLDRLETSLKRWAPNHFRYLDHTFGLKQTKQKICKECGLKTNREEKLLNVDCQIRGKSDIHEALGAMTEVEIMEGNNKVFCDRCKKNTDTILRTAISTLPNMLILSLKRFDLDYNTFETVKLNSRCAFGQTLNMKRYTLEGLEEMERCGQTADGGPAPMDTSGSDNPGMTVTGDLQDEDYEYKLAGVLVHAGVAQGGHYYSFINDRNQGEEKWYRFDDEDVTPFDPALIEVECFGGKVKKETKWPNGQVHTVESEQYANALMLFYEKVRPSDTPSDAEFSSAKKAVATTKSVEMTSGYDVFEPDVHRSNATHRWQTFLFDAEFQAFLKGLLGLCRLSSSELDKVSSHESTLSAVQTESTESSWRASVVQMLLTFVFDVLLYSSEKNALGDWVRMLEETLLGDRVCAINFVHKLALKTKEVSACWLRNYLSDCPDQISRTAAVRIFTSACQSCIQSEEEQRELESWAKAWREQVLKIGSSGTPIPCGLEGDWRSHEDVQIAAAAGVSNLGVILSYLNLLVDTSPRNWRYNPELTLFLRNLANIDAQVGGNGFRRAMIESLVPARLICLIVRERAPAILRAAFPGASVAMEVAETQMRAEQNPTSHMMPLSGNQGLNPSEINYRGGGSPIDHLSSFEALGCLLGLRGVVHEPLILEVEDAGRGRQRVALSDQAAAALQEVFEQSCAPSAIGMGQREIEMYLQRCGVDSASVPTQKIIDIMAKYPTTSGGNGANGTSYLSLEGFLAYYRDTAQTNEVRVRLDLHTFGFRPNLSRRSSEARVFSVQGREQQRTSAESVAIDVSSHHKNQSPNLGRLADLGLLSFPLYGTAYSASEPLAEYILAGATYGRNSESIIISTLKAIYNAPSGWAGTETLNAALMVLRVLASLPDDRQNERISMMMQCNERATVHGESGIGLMVAARWFYGTRASQHYPNEIHYAYDRYVGTLKDLLGLHCIFIWMSENRHQWNWMERDILEPHQVAAHPNQMRVDYPGRREVDGNTVPLVHHHHSDSDMQGINDSEEEDEDESHYETQSHEEMETTYREGPTRVIVEGAGHPGVNGMYARDGYFEQACKYSRPGEHKGEQCLFSLFKCNVSNNTKHWYISIVPVNGQPGTSADVDFYSAPVTDSCTDLPPTTGWTKSNEGRDPPPTLSFTENKGEDTEQRGGRVEPVWNNSVGEADENQGGRPYA